MSVTRLADRQEVSNQVPTLRAPPGYPDETALLFGPSAWRNPRFDAPPVSLARPIPFALRVPSNVPGFGFEWSHGEQAGRRFEGLTAPKAMDAFRHAWRVNNGSDWHWRITFDGFELVSDRDELIEGLDDLSSGTIAVLTVHLRQAS